MSNANAKCSNAQCQRLNAKCSNAKCQMLNAKCQMSNARFVLYLALVRIVTSDVDASEASLGSNWNSQYQLMKFFMIDPLLRIFFTSFFNAPLCEMPITRNTRICIHSIAFVCTCKQRHKCWCGDGNDKEYFECRMQTQTQM